MLVQVDHDGLYLGCRPTEVFPKELYLLPDGVLLIGGVLVDKHVIEEISILRIEELGIIQSLF